MGDIGKTVFQVHLKVMCREKLKRDTKLAISAIYSNMRDMQLMIDSLVQEVKDIDQSKSVYIHASTKADNMYNNTLSINFNFTSHWQRCVDLLRQTNCNKGVLTC